MHFLFFLLVLRRLISGYHESNVIDRNIYLDADFNDQI
jgi:hypothetical protein